MARYTPEKCADIEEIIRDALQNETPLQVTGYGTKKNLGGRVLARDELSLSALSGITDYQPEELVMVARSGTPLIEIEETLDKNGQMLGFEPLHLDKFYGQSTPGSLAVLSLVTYQARAAYRLGLHGIICWGLMLYLDVRAISALVAK